MADPDLPGFSYDAARARALRELLAFRLKQAQDLGATATDQLAALGLTAVQVIRGSGFVRVQDRAIEALAAFIREALRMEP